MNRIELLSLKVLKLSLSVLGLALLTFLVGRSVEARQDQASLASEYMVAAANPLAVEAGLSMLRRGGSAVDAVIAVQMVLSLVEPQSSGVGGGAFLVHFNPAKGKGQAGIEIYDGRERAPMKAGPNLFLDINGKRLSFHEAGHGGKAVGVPGVMRMLWLAHQEQGKLSWEKLFEPAIKLAEEGFVVSPRLHDMIEAARSFLPSSPAARAYFYAPDGEAWPVGHWLKNPAYGKFLRKMAAEGVGDFYDGKIATDIIKAVVGSVHSPGLLALSDLRTYQPSKRSPLCGDYRRYKVCGMPPPSSGGIASLQILGMINRFDIGAYRPDDPQVVHLIAEAQRFAFADRNYYLADADFTAVPVAGLLNSNYIKSRSALINPKTSGGKARHGIPPKAHALKWGGDNAPPVHGTSHISIVDASGRALAMTTTVQSAFGSGLLVHGFLLNNQLTDFSFEPVKNGKKVANRVEPGKKPLSSMTPTLVFDPKERLHLVVGSPGGRRIIGYVTQTLIGVLDWGLDIQQAMNLPHFLNLNGPTELEPAPGTPELAKGLEARGHKVKIRNLTSGLHGISIEYPMKGKRVLKGGADPRREGVARGK